MFWVFIDTFLSIDLGMRTHNVGIVLYVIYAYYHVMGILWVCNLTFKYCFGFALPHMFWYSFIVSLYIVTCGFHYHLYLGYILL